MVNVTVDKSECATGDLACGSRFMLIARGRKTLLLLTALTHNTSTGVAVSRAETVFIVSKSLTYRIHWR